MKALILPVTTPGLALARPSDESFVLKVMKQHTECLGFLPTAAIVGYIAAGRLLIGRENESEAGYILGREGMRYDPSIAPITQVAVDMSLKRRSLGLSLVNEWVDQAFADGRACVQCWCADDIDAALFWPAAGFVAVARRWPDNSRRRSLTLWRRGTFAGFLEPRHTVLPPLAGYRASKVGRVENLIDGRVRPSSLSGEQLTFDCLIDDGRVSAFK